MDPFIGEIRMLGFPFAPRGWAFCNGATLPISQNTTVYSLLGNFFGGDGRSSFGLPNLQGNVPMGAGNGPGLSSRVLGQSGGSATVTLQQSEIPSHTHTMMCAGGRFSADSADVSGNAFSNSVGGKPYGPAGSQAQLSGNALQPFGGNGPHNNMMPYLTTNFVIALQGMYPLRP